MSLLKEKFSGGRGHSPAVDQIEAVTSGLPEAGSPKTTPEMVRRTRMVELHEEEFTGSGEGGVTCPPGGISCPRRTSTPEIVRIRTTEAAALEKESPSKASEAKVKGCDTKNNVEKDKQNAKPEVVRYKVESQKSEDRPLSIKEKQGGINPVEEKQQMSQRQVGIINLLL